MILVTLVSNFQNMVRMQVWICITRFFVHFGVNMGTNFGFWAAIPYQKQGQVHPSPPGQWLLFAGFTVSLDRGLLKQSHETSITQMMLKQYFILSRLIKNNKTIYDDDSHKRLLFTTITWVSIYIIANWNLENENVFGV